MIVNVVHVVHVDVAVVAHALDRGFTEIVGAFFVGPIYG